MIAQNRPPAHGIESGSIAGGNGCSRGRAAASAVSSASQRSSGVEGAAVGPTSSASSHAWILSQSMWPMTTTGRETRQHAMSGLGEGKKTHAMVDSKLLDGVVRDGKCVDGNRWVMSEVGCEFRNNNAERCWGCTL